MEQNLITMGLYIMAVIYVLFFTRQLHQCPFPDKDKLDLQLYKIMALKHIYAHWRIMAQRRWDNDLNFCLQNSINDDLDHFTSSYHSFAAFGLSMFCGSCSLKLASSLIARSPVPVIEPSINLPLLVKASLLL